MDEAFELVLVVRVRFFITSKNSLIFECVNLVVVDFAKMVTDI